MEMNPTQPTRSNLREIDVRFDERLPYGTSDHFYHFLLGYLLPAVHELSLYDREQLQQDQFVFRSCGPLMDPIIREVAGFIDINFAIAPQGSFMRFAHHLLVPRWDVFMIRPHLLTPSRGESTVLGNVRDAFQRELPEDWKYFVGPDFVENFRRAVTRVGDLLLLYANQEMNAARYEPIAGRYLILQRSKEHPYYPGAGSSYGESRRALRGIEYAAHALEQRGLKVTVFEAGAHSLAGQILAFHACRGLAMIRGAEIANLIWMRPGSPVLVVTPSAMVKNPSPLDMLVELVPFCLTHVVSEDMYPTLASDLVEGVFCQAELTFEPKFNNPAGESADGLPVSADAGCRP